MWVHGVKWLVHIRDKNKMFLSRGLVLSTPVVPQAAFPKAIAVCAFLCHWTMHLTARESLAVLDLSVIWSSMGLSQMVNYEGLWGYFSWDGCFNSLQEVEQGSATRKTSGPSPLSDRKASVSWTRVYIVLLVDEAVSPMKIRVLSTVKHSLKMRDLKNFLRTRKMNRWTLVMFLKENMFFRCSIYLFYKNWFALCSYFLLPSYL